MDNRRSQLTESLKRATGLADTYRSDLVQKNIIPILRELSLREFIDPSIFKTSEEYAFALNIANLKSLAYKELLTKLEEAEGRVKTIRTELEKLNLIDGE